MLPPQNVTIKNTIIPIPAIILAGGLGTRLRSVINDLPKPMAIINGKPFLHYVLLYLSKQNVAHAILSVGYKATIIESYFGDKYLNVNLEYSREEEPLGTGGAIKKALDLVTDYAYILNGDTFFDIDLESLQNFYYNTEAEIVLALKQMTNFDRYGSVCMEHERIVRFEEKKATQKGLINGGVYFLHKRLLDKTNAKKFSFETDILERYVNEESMNGVAFDNYFIDIGIPEDYTKAQGDFKAMFG